MTTTYDKLDTINDSLNDIKTAVIAKGQTPSGDITTYATAIGNITILNGDTLSVTPTTSAQTLTPTSPKNGFTQVSVSAVTSSIDNNIQAANIVSGVSILGVNGSATVLNGETRTETLTSSAGNTFTPSSGKNAITSITVTPTNEARTVNPSTSLQSLTVNSGYSGNGTITVNPVTSSIDANITAENIKKDVQILGVTGSLESGGGGAYQLRRIKDDNNIEIGTAFMVFTDKDGNQYDVVCLDAKYRLNNTRWGYNYSVANLPVYKNLYSSNVFSAKQTATQNTTLILATSSTASSCVHCRNQSFTINGTVYQGQFPNLLEIIGIARYYDKLNTMDISASTYSAKSFSSAQTLLSSSQYSSTECWSIFTNCVINYNNKSSGNSGLLCPVIEIPIN